MEALSVCRRDKCSGKINQAAPFIAPWAALEKDLVKAIKTQVFIGLELEIVAMQIF